MDRKKYYVYAHKKPGTEELFYIGKGCGRRAYRNSHRTNYWNNIVKKYGGFDVEFLHTNLSESEALSLEIHYISLYKNKLCNLTEGGEGMSGYKLSEENKLKIGARYKGKNLSEEHRKKISESHKGKILSEEHKLKMSIAQKGKPSHLKGVPLKEEHKLKISKSLSGNNHPNFGKHLSNETKNKISNKNSGSNNKMSKKIIIYDIEVNKEIKFETLTACSKYIGVSIASVRNYYKSKKLLQNKFRIIKLEN